MLVLFASALEAKIFGSTAASLLGDMKGSLDALNMQLDALLIVLRLDADTVAPRKTKFALSTLLDRRAIQFGLQASDKAIALMPVGTLIVSTDPTLLYRVLDNFLSNAIRCTSQDTILLGYRHRG